MKKLFFSLLATIATCTLLSSCCVTSPVCATSVPLGSKMGETSQQFVLGFAFTQGGGIQEAAKSAGITKISHIDVQTQPLYPIIGKKTTIVYGE